MTSQIFNSESKSRCKAYYVVGDKGEWGPIPWSNLRLWLAMCLFDANVELRESDSVGRKFKASAVERLWKIAGRDFALPPPSDRKEDMGGNPAAEALPCSPEMRRYLIEILGWPGRTDILNYSSADAIRAELERIFLDPKRPLFDDPDWPVSWHSFGPPAEMARREAEKEQERSMRPASERQLEVLRFFNVSTDDVSLAQAHHLIDEIFADADKKRRWESARDTAFSAEPATEPQLFRLKFAAARLKKRLPSQLSKKSAHDLIDEWFKDKPDLEAEYQQMKEGQMMADMELDHLCGELNDWREFHHLSPIPDKVVREAVSELGRKIPTEAGATYYDRILKHIAATRSDLVERARLTPLHPANRSAKLGVDRLVVVLVLAALIVALVLLNR